MIEYDKETEYITMFKEVAHIRAKNIKFGSEGLTMTKKTNDDRTTSIFFTIKLSSKMYNLDNAKLKVMCELISKKDDRIIEINHDESISTTNLYTIEVKIKNVKYEEQIQLYLRMLLNKKKIVDKLFDITLHDESFYKVTKYKEEKYVIKIENDDAHQRKLSTLNTIIEKLKTKTRQDEDENDNG